MDELTGFTKGKIKQPLLIICYGPDGVGKSTFAAESTNPIFIGPERGTSNLDVARFDTSTWTDVISKTSDLLLKKHSFKTVVFDSLDFIESMMWAHICKEQEKDAIEDCFGGYGKWVNGTVQEFSKLMLMLSDLRETRKMNVICIAHSQVKTVNDPMQLTPYDRYTLKLQDRSAAKWREFVDAVLFATFEDTVFKVKPKDSKAKVTGAGVRKLFTTRRAAWDAKNRLGLPEELPLSFSAFSQAVDFGQPDSLENVERDIKELAQALSEKDKSMSERMISAALSAGQDLAKLINIRNHARVLVEST